MLENSKYRKNLCQNKTHENITGENIPKKVIRQNQNENRKKNCSDTYDKQKHRNTNQTAIGQREKKAIGMQL